MAAKGSGMRIHDVALAVDWFLESIYETLVKGETIEMRGFGKFIIKEYCNMIGRNKLTGEVFTLPPRNMVRFKPANLLKRRIMGKDLEVKGAEK
tara:strand:+ start:2328 stop:2609 length:282 start_codon:yes stop_codon:yes gene_type:complete